MTTIFLFPKQSHQSELALFLLLKIGEINLVKLTKPFVVLCDSSSIGTITKDFLLLYGCVSIITKQKQVSTTTQSTHDCNDIIFKMNTCNYLNLPMDDQYKACQQICFIHLFALMIIYQGGTSFLQL